MAHFPSCNILLWTPPPSFSSPEKLIDPLCAESCVSSVRIIPGGIGCPLLPCSWEPCSCPFLILPALTSQWHWAPQESLCFLFEAGNGKDVAEWSEDDSPSPSPACTCKIKNNTEYQLLRHASVCVHFENSREVFYLSHKVSIASLICV